MSDRSKGILFAIISVFLYSLIPVFGKVAVSEFPPLFVAFAVNLLAGVWLGVVGLARKELSLKLIKKKNTWLIFIGFFAGLGSLFAFTGLSIGRATDAGFFFQFAAFFVPILAFFFLKEKLSKFQIGGLVLMFLGAVIFTTASINIFNKAILLFLGASFSWSINDVIVRGKRNTLSPFVMAFARNVFSSLFLIFFAYSYLITALSRFSFQTIISFLLYGATVAGIILFAYLALKYLKAAEAVSFNVLIPLITSAIAFFTLGESLVLSQVIGGVVILIGLFAIIKKSKD